MNLFKLLNISLLTMLFNVSFFSCSSDDEGEATNSEEKDVGGNIGSAVDLGLSVKWADRNIGASTPEDYGAYFAWGEIKEKETYVKDNSIAYGKSISELKSNGFIDDNWNLLPSYDAATANWKNGWRMPTIKEMHELVDNCKWSFRTKNGIGGYVVEGLNGNTIFLPCAGWEVDSTRNQWAQGKYGSYWTASVSSDKTVAYYLFYSDSYIRFDYGYYEYFYRHYGMSIRPVKE